MLFVSFRLFYKLIHPTNDAEDRTVFVGSSSATKLLASRTYGLKWLVNTSVRIQETGQVYGYLESS